MAKLFFSGIAGSGLSALASFAADKGHAVAGSDRLFDRMPTHPFLRTMRAKGIAIAPQDGSGIDASFDCVVFSTAVEDDNPEAVKARAANIPVATRPRFLSDTISRYRAIAVAGTSGKSTTAGLLAYVMRGLGMQPNFLGGGRVKQFRDERNLGNAISGDSDLLVFEACESDGSIVDYAPCFSIFMNAELDHNPIADTVAMFAVLGEKTGEALIVNADDGNLARCHFERAVTFSLEKDAHFRAESLAHSPFSVAFRVRGVPFSLPLPGRHNAYNALACIALLATMGIRLSDIAAVMRDFAGVERRFDIHLRNGRFLVIDDYAHNPHKIAALMETVRDAGPRICYVFQPHGFGPTRFMRREYVDAFARHLRAGDSLMMLPIFYAGGTSVRDISSEDLCRDISASGKRAEALPNRQALFERIGEWDKLVIFGARDESLADFSREIAERLR